MKTINEEEDDKKPFIPDSTLSEAEFVAKYYHKVISGDLTEEYLRVRWLWMKNKATWPEVCEAYMKTKAAKAK